jgi:hypothetical protein
MPDKSTQVEETTMTVRIGVNGSGGPATLGSHAEAAAHLDAANRLVDVVELMAS